MKEFIKSLFSDKDGSISSKRFVMFTLVLSFVVIIFVNLFTGKALKATLEDQLFYLVIYVLISIFGENMAEIFKKKPPVQ
jgi:hypothetical protein